jgi:AcrR family transcriptional regulator
VTARPAPPAADPDGALRATFARYLGDAPELTGLSAAALRVLAAAAALFYRRGYAATSVRELARDCGLSPGAMYNHFASLDEILYLLAAVGHGRVERAITAAMADSDGTAEDELRRFVRAYVERHLAFPPFAQLIHREFVHLSPQRRAVIVECRRRVRDRLVGIMRAGTGSGAFRPIPGADPEVRAAMMILDMCARTSEWFDPAKAAVGPSDLADGYVAAAVRLVHGTD